MSMNRPTFMDSPFFVDDPGNWHLKEGASNELQKEFKDFMASMEDENVPGTINGNHISTYNV